MRTDIPLADQIVQVGHTCLAVGWQFAPPAGACHLVVLVVASEAQLRVVFEEPDDALGATAACSEPIYGVALLSLPAALACAGRAGAGARPACPAC